MTELRDYILSKLQERTKQGKIDFPKTTIMGKAAREQAAKFLRHVKARYSQSGLANAPGEPARATKEFIGTNYRLVGDPKPEPQRSSTDLRTQLAYVLADKLEELKIPIGGIPRDESGRVSSDAKQQVAAGALATARTGKVPDKRIKPPKSGVVDLATHDRTNWRPATGEEKQAAGRVAANARERAGVTLAPRPDKPKQPKPVNASTDLRTQLMYILADKLDEVNKPRLNVPDPTDRPKPEPVPTEPVKPPKPLAKYKRPKSNKPPITEELKAKIAYILANKIDEIILPSFEVNKQEIQDRKTRGMKPFPTTNKPTPNKAQLMRDAAKAAADAVKKPKPMPSITDVPARDYLPQPDLPKPGEGSKGPTIFKKPDLTKGIRFK